jgi:hypothetical protein
LLELQKQLPAAGAGDLILQLLEQAARVVAEPVERLDQLMASMELQIQVAEAVDLEQMM